MSGVPAVERALPTQSLQSSWKTSRDRLIDSAEWGFMENKAGWKDHGVQQVQVEAAQKNVLVPWAEVEQARRGKHRSARERLRPAAKPHPTLTPTPHHSHSYRLLWS